MDKLLTVGFTLLFFSLCGQSSENMEKLAMASFYKKDFLASLMYSEQVIESNSNHVPSLFFAGESARMMDNLAKAEAYLEKIPDEAKDGSYAVTDFHLGLVKHQLGKKEEAEGYYKRYLDQHYDEGDLYSHLAENAIHSLVTGDDWVREGYINKLSNRINSDRADFAPLRYANRIYFSSVLEDNYLPTKSKKKNKKMEQHPVSRLYQAGLNGKARKLETNPRSAVLNASNISFMPDASRMYYTLCGDENPEQQDKCQIYYRDRNYDGTWNSAVKLPKHINEKRYTSTQPSVGYDKRLNKYVLYFVSDRLGGYGGKDIWCSVIERDGAFGKPYALPINTPGDDITPFYHQPTQTLFFSTCGWNSNGGFDIFHVVKKSEHAWGVPVNMGRLINSKADEFYYTYHTTSKMAYFVSGKIGEDHMDADIYEANVFVGFHVRVFNKQNQKPLNNAYIEIENFDTGEKEFFSTGEVSHEARLKLQPGNNYLISIKADGYQKEMVRVDTEGFSYFKLEEKNIFLKPYVRP